MVIFHSYVSLPEGKTTNQLVIPTAPFLGSQKRVEAWAKFLANALRSVRISKDVRGSCLKIGHGTSKP